MDDLDRVIAGQCIHGYPEQKDCMACLMTRNLVLNLRRMLGSLFSATQPRGR